MSVWEELRGGGGATGTWGATSKQTQSPAADKGKPVELWGHEQCSTQVALPRHSKRDLVKRNRCVPEKRKIEEENLPKKSIGTCELKRVLFMFFLLTPITFYKLEYGK